MTYTCVKCGGMVEAPHELEAAWAHHRIAGCPTPGMVLSEGGPKIFDCKKCHASWWVSAESIGKIANSHLIVGKCGGPIVERGSAYETPSTPDQINHPDHYTQGKIECIDALEAALSPDEFKGFLKGNVMKYLWRSEHKNGKQDLEKAKWYLEKLLALGTERN